MSLNRGLRRPHHRHAGRSLYRARFWISCEARVEFAEMDSAFGTVSDDDALAVERPGPHLSPHGVPLVAALGDTYAGGSASLFPKSVTLKLSRSSLGAMTSPRPPLRAASVSKNAQWWSLLAWTSSGPRLASTRLGQPYGENLAELGGEFVIIERDDVTPESLP